MFQFLLYMHISCGAVALLCGLIALIVKKGHKLHILTGNIFYWAMILVALTSFIMATIKFNPFLLSIGIFTLYMILQGKRSIFYYHLRETYTPAGIDKWPVYIGLVTSLFMFVFPIYYHMQYGDSNIFVLAVFGLILLLNVRGDLKALKANKTFEPNNPNWILKHIGMMTGAYIASTTAFLVNTVHIEQSWILWLLPTAIGTPYIFISAKKWKKSTI
ncbi:MAG: DUF2306 domain-containing protein [Bacteroidetes bacterium]|nr:DUF2306 domain-containing protein [Bacteroidota bacterium]